MKNIKDWKIGDIGYFCKVGRVGYSEKIPSIETIKLFCAIISDIENKGREVRFRNDNTKGDHITAFISEDKDKDTQKYTNIIFETKKEAEEYGKELYKGFVAKAKIQIANEIKYNQEQLKKLLQEQKSLDKIKA